MVIPDVPPLGKRNVANVQATIDGKAKPLGALGRLEALALQIALIMGTARQLQDARLIVFAGDHGLTVEGVSAYPSNVSGAIANLVLAGTAGASIMAAASGIDVVLVDSGLLHPCGAHSRLRDRRIAAGTRNSRRGAAMTISQRDAAFAAGVEIVDTECQKINIVALGEIGIGNSSAAALVAHAVTGIPLAQLIGPGAGAPAGGLDHKRDVLTAAYARAPTCDPATALAEFAGFEMVMLTAAMIGAAAGNRIVLVDGFIATACAAAAVALNPNVRERLVFAHTSAEPGHRLLLDYLGATPLLDLGMRCGEGTGAALAVPLVRAAGAILTDLANLPAGSPP